MQSEAHRDHASYGYGKINFHVETLYWHWPEMSPASQCHYIDVNDIRAVTTTNRYVKNT